MKVESGLRGTAELDKMGNSPAGHVLASAGIQNDLLNVVCPYCLSWRSRVDSDGQRRNHFGVHPISLEMM